MLFIGYHAWKEKQQAIITDDDLVECPACSGVGELACKCCGSDRLCNLCDGEGRVCWGSLLKSQQAKLFTPEQYRRVLLDEAIAYGNWTRTDPIELLINDGFAPWQDLERKEIQININ